MEKNNAGFTLLELIVVVSIITIFAGSSLFYYNDFSQKARLEEAANNIVTIMEIARQKAVSSDSDDFACSQFSGYEFNITGSNYLFRLCCDSSCSTAHTIQSAQLPSGIIPTVVGSSTIRFLPVAFSTNLSTDTAITLRNEAVSRCITITVAVSGLINKSEQDSC